MEWNKTYHGKMISIFLQMVLSIAARSDTILVKQKQVYFNLKSIFPL